MAVVGSLHQKKGGLGLHLEIEGLLPEEAVKSANFYEAVWNPNLICVGIFQISLKSTTRIKIKMKRWRVLSHGGEVQPC